MKIILMCLFGPPAGLSWPIIAFFVAVPYVHDAKIAGTIIYSVAAAGFLWSILSYVVIERFKKEEEK